ncbi:MAG: hemerythrin domain-containing protein, partial [Candidatus Pacebacteria bacterium]|nr:hemerythrin domain-containing protein [Candidatus Paceibacterota bacterium]
YDPHFVVEKLIKISAQIKYHLSMEDAFIYPKSASSSNADLKALAVKMQEDMVPISAAFGAYVNSWNPDRIGKERAAFVAETKGIAAALKTRIDNEEKNLYPLVANIL